MPALAEASRSTEIDKIAVALERTRYTYPRRETPALRPPDAIDSQRVLADYMAAISLARRRRDLQGKIDRMKDLRPNWDTYGAEPPSKEVTDFAGELVLFMETRDFLPTDVTASAEGGVALSFTTTNRYADIEILNSGEILAATFTRQQEPVVWEVRRTQDDIFTAIERIYDHISA